MDETTGCVQALFAAQRHKLTELLPDFGQRVGYDGKAIQSHSTGRKLAHRVDPLSGECLSSDPDATWGCHKQFGTDSNGKEVQTKKRWFGYELHLLGDVNYELPIGFTLAPAHEAEHPHCEALVSEFIGSECSERCESFVADRGLDSNRLRKRLFEADILSVIANRNLWQDENLDSDQLRVATRCLDENKFDTLLRTEHGDLYCKCPESEQIRPMHYQGYEKKARHAQVGLFDSAKTSASLFEILVNCRIHQYYGCIRLLYPTHLQIQIQSAGRLLSFSDLVKHLQGQIKPSQVPAQGVRTSIDSFDTAELVCTSP